MEARKMKMKGDDDLPLNLIETEILPRLPAKSLGCCMCVCKRWKSFLSTPTFAQMRPRTIDDYKLLLCDGPHLRTLPLTELCSIPIPYTPNPFLDPIIVATLDGLVCLASGQVPTNLVFWNPLTGAYRKLSKIPFYCPPSSSDVVGFYIDSSYDYKLVYLKSEGDFRAYIYSHRLETWREIDFPFGPRPSSCIWSPATFLGQCFYFTVTTDYTSIKTPRWWIICFDVETETFREIGFPPIQGGTRFFNGGNLVILNGHIHLCVSYVITIRDKWWKHDDLWRMDGDDGWVKVVAFKDSLDTYGYELRSRKHICIASTCNWLAVLDQENNSFKKVNTEDFIIQYPYISSPSWNYTSSRIIYVETLVSPNSSK